MTGQELLDYIATNALRDRAGVPGADLWADDTILLYINEAIEQFCRRTHAHVDNAISLDINSSTNEYQLQDTVLFVKSARISTDPRPLADKTFSRVPDDLLTTQAKPSMYIMDESQMAIIRFWPTPDQDYTVNIRAAMVPDPITVSTLDDTVKIPARYHIGLSDWVVYRAHAENDADGRDLAAADKAKARWEQHVQSAKLELYRFRMGQNPVVAQSWTGKRNGR